MGLAPFFPWATPMKFAKQSAQSANERKFQVEGGFMDDKWEIIKDLRRLCRRMVQLKGWGTKKILDISVPFPYFSMLTSSA